MAYDIENRATLQDGSMFEGYHVTHVENAISTLNVAPMQMETYVFKVIVSWQTIKSKSFAFELNPDYKRLVRYAATLPVTGA